MLIDGDNAMINFKGTHFPKDVILMAMRCYL